MTLNRTALTAALLTATALVSAPAFAQDAHRDNKQREAARAAQERAQQPQREQQEQRAQQAERAQQQPQPQREQQAPRIEQRRQDNSQRIENPRGDVVGRAVPRTEHSTVVAPRYNDRRDYEHGNYNGRYNDRGYNDRGYNDRGYNDRGYNDRGYYGRDRGYYSPRSYYRPYVFRPRLSIGFGIFSGYPVPYSYSYPYPIEVYGYRAPRAPVMVGPGSPYYGGVALEMGPYDADVFVDGNYAGKVEDFDGTSQPLTLVAGTHRIEVQAPGYAPLIFDVTVQPGQVIPYRGDLRPY